ncbi:MAG: HEAT repeat domain-containing protein [Lyngbya sp. HA4199-MV5]|jgi:HEAT repeat protein|nr:HEAT repeat domain-containing protein [Lyngbya sp. HA4199-MV5]
MSAQDMTPQLERERELAAQLVSPHERVRLQAAESLIARASLNAGKQLLALLGDESWRVRRVAVEGLAQRQTPDVIEALMHSLRQDHQNPSVLNGVLQVLARGQIDVVPLLEECLQDADVDLRIYAITALQNLQDPRVVTILLKALQDADANVQYHAIDALGHQRTVEAVEALLAIAESRDFFLGFPALDALSRIGVPTIASRLLPLLEDDLLCTPAANALATLGDASMVPALVQRLNEGTAPVGEIVKALVTLHDRYETELQEGCYIADLTQAALTEAGLQQFFQTLHNTYSHELLPFVTLLGWLETPVAERALIRLLAQPSVNQQVVAILIQHGTRVVPLLIDNLTANNADARRLTVEALGRIGDRRAVPALLQLLDAEPELMIYAATALGRIGDERAADALLRLLAHPLAVTRQTGVAALNALGCNNLSTRIESLLSSPNPFVRESATKIAGYFAFPQHQAVLLTHCTDANERVRVAAIEALPCLESPDSVACLVHALDDSSPKVRAAVARGLAQIDRDTAYEPLLVALNDGDDWVQYYAIRSLGLLRYPEAVAPLAQLTQAHISFSVRLAAIEALGKIGDGAAATALIGLAPIISADNDLDRAILTALGQTTHPHALTFLLGALKSTDPERRIVVLQALGQQSDSRVVESLQWIAATDETTRVMDAAIATLARFKTPETIAALIELTADRRCRGVCINTLAQLPASCLATIANGLHHVHPEVRHAMVKVLTRLKHPQASQYLYQALTDTNETVRLAVMVSLSQLGNYQITQQLQTISQTDPDPLIRQVADNLLA